MLSEGLPVVAGWLLALTISAVLAIPVLKDPFIVALPYQAWNWSVRHFSLLAVRYVTAVTFWTVGLIYSIGPHSSQFELNTSPNTTWKDRNTQTVQEYTSEYRNLLPVNGSHWTAPVRAWMNSRGPSLSWVFLPFLILIQLLETGTQKTDDDQTNIYTLY